MNNSLHQILFIAALASTAVCMVAGCTTPRKSEPLAGPLENESREVRNGRTVFMRHCHECHPGGEGGLGPSLNDKPLPGFLTRFQVRHGLGVMPSFDEKRISPEELDHLVAYMRALRQNKPGLAGR